MIQSINAPAPRQDQPPYQPGEPVALFIPCYIDQFYPSIGQATVSCCKSTACRWSFPTDQTCCGQPAFNSGYWEEARRVIHHFCDVLEATPLDRLPLGLVHGDVPRVFRPRRSRPTKWSASAAGCSS